MISLLFTENFRKGLLVWTALVFLAGCSIHGVQLRLRATSTITPGVAQTFSEAQIQEVVKIAREVAKEFDMRVDPHLSLVKGMELGGSELVASYEKPRSTPFGKRGDWARVTLSVWASKDKSELHITVADRDSFELTPFVREIQEAIKQKVKEVFPGYTMEWKEG